MTTRTRLMRGTAITSIIVGLAIPLLPAAGSVASPSIGSASGSGPGHWVQAGGPATSGLDILIDPSSARVAYAASGDDYVLKSLDGGLSWSPLQQGLADTDVTVVAMDPVDALTLYAGTERNGLFKSMDGGASWSLKSIGLPADAGIDSIAVDPTDALTVFAGANDFIGLDSLFKSTDGAETWTPSDAGLPDGIDVMDLAIVPSNASIIYAGTDKPLVCEGDGVYKSTDGGASWVSVNTQDLAKAAVHAVVIDAGAPDTVYAGAFDSCYDGNGGVFKTTDGGATWSRVAKTASVSALAMDPRHPRILFAGGDTGIAKSTDEGATWRSVSRGLTGLPVHAVQVNPRRSQVAIAGTSGALFRTTDGGRTWGAATNLLGAAFVKAIAADPVDGDTLYVGTSLDGVFKATDGGQVWAQINTGLPGLDVNALAVDHTDSRIVYAAPPFGGVFKSTDGGTTWVPANEGISRTNVYSLAIDPVDSQVVYAGAGSSVYKTTDGGQSWAGSSVGQGQAGDIEALVIDPSNPQVLYAGGYEGSNERDGVYKSTSGGGTWFRSSQGITGPASSVTALAIDPSSPGTLYAAVSCTYDECADAYVYKTTDGAALWTSSIYVYSYYWFSSIVIDPADPDTVYAGHFEFGVHRTVDAGVTWESINDGLPDDHAVNALVMSAGRVLYSGTAYGGVFRFVE